MPYVKKIVRSNAKNLGIEKVIDEFFSCFSDEEVGGVLNYLTFLTVRGIVKRRGTSYTLLNSIIGALDCCKEEVRRRILNPYEDKKIKENGDV